MLPLQQKLKFDLANTNPQCGDKPSSFEYNEHDLVVDESVPIRHDMSVGGYSQPQSRGFRAHYRALGLVGYGSENGGLLFGSSDFSPRGHISIMTGQGPAGGKLTVAES